MTSPPGAEDELLGTLSSRERSMLAAWADDGDVPDDFADRVVAAYLAEADEDPEATVARPRPAASDGKLVRLVGWAAAIAAAAAVMLMVRVLPRASEVEQVADGHHETAVARAPVPGQPPLEAEHQGDATCDHEDGASEPPSVGSSPEPVLEVLGREAGIVLAEHCSPCHDSTAPDASLEALLVYDLEQPQWWLTLSDVQLEDVRMRIQGLGAASDDQRRQVNAFIEARQQQVARAG